MKEEVFYKHVRETTFTKDYTVCGKVVGINLLDFGDPEYNRYEFYELHIAAYVFPVDKLFIKKEGCANSLAEVEKDPWLKIKVDEYSLHTFLDIVKILTPTKAIKKKVYLDQVIN